MRKSNKNKEYRSQTIQIYPTNIQEKYFKLCIDFNTDCYNYLVNHWSNPNGNNMKDISYYDLCKLIKDMNYHLDKSVFPQCIQETASERFHEAINMFSLGHNRPPKFHKKGKYRESFELRLSRKNKNRKDTHSFDKINNKYYFKIAFGRFFGFKNSYENNKVLMAEELKYPYDNFQAKTVTIFKRAGHWYANFQIEVELDKSYSKHKIDKVGIDLGISKLLTLYDSNKLVSFKLWEQKTKNKILKLEERIKNYQKILEKCKFNSKKYLKIKLKLEKCYNNISNIKNNFLHHLSLELVQTYKEINIEQFDIPPLIKRGKRTNKGLRRSISQQKWEYLRQLIIYKGKQYNTKVNLCDQKQNKSSKRCSSCNNIQDMPLYKRVYSCPQCGLNLDRDVNAAINIYNYI